jgi:protein-tyrosine phosphatase
MLQAAATSVLLSVFFVIVYGGTNWLTAHRPSSQVGTWLFTWELAIVPYVPLLYAPYMSLDVLFFAAPFLCRDEQEIRIFAQRVVFAVLVAAAFFLFLPLTLAWPPRPRVGGWFGDFVERSCSVPFLMEHPHNLFPSLHIALCLVVADIYARHTHGTVRALAVGWFGLIGVATLLTWQHHMVDLAGGALLGAFAFHLFREPAARLSVVANIHVGLYYAVGASAVAAVVPVVWPWGTFLLWPAAGLGMVAGAYFGLGPIVFRKTDGCLPLSTRVVLLPVLLGHHLSFLYYRRQCRAWDELAPGVLIGRALTVTEAGAAVQQGVTAVLDLTAELSETKVFRDLKYRNLPIIDLTAPTQEQLHEAAAFIGAEAAKGTVYVHCKVGYSRTAAVAGAYLLATHQAADADSAAARLRKVRPSIIIRPEALAALRAFAQRQTEMQGVERNQLPSAA